MESGEDDGETREGRKTREINKNLLDEDCMAKEPSKDGRKWVIKVYI